MIKVKILLSGLLVFLISVLQARVYQIDIINKPAPEQSPIQMSGINPAGTNISFALI